MPADVLRTASAYAAMSGGTLATDDCEHWPSLSLGFTTTSAAAAAAVADTGQLNRQHNVIISSLTK